MKINVNIIIFFLLLSHIIMGQKINDVSKKQADYKMIKDSVKYGYLSLYENNMFQGDSPILRREMALIINKLNENSDKKNINLSKEDVSELQFLSKSFKRHLANTDNVITQHDLNIESLKQNQTVLNYEISELTAQINELKQRQVWSWVGMAIIGILGLVM